MEIKKVEKAKKSNSKKVLKALLWISLPAALAVAFFAGRESKNNPIDIEVTNTEGKVLPTIEEKEMTLDEEISDSATEFIESVKKSLGEDYEISQEEVETWIRNFNAENEEYVLYDDISFQKDMIQSLMQAEILNFQKKDISTPLDSIEFKYLILDRNVRAKELITEVDEAFDGLMGSTSDEEKTKYAQEITNLFGNSWIAGGYNGVIPVAKLEKSGNEVIIMTYMMMSQVCADLATENFYVRPPYICDGKPISGNEMLQEVNKGCEDGSLNELSAALLGTISEANTALKEKNILGLNLN